MPEPHQQTVEALANVAALASMTTHVRIRAVVALGNHWPSSYEALKRIAESGTVFEVTEAARKVLAEHESWRRDEEPTNRRAGR